MFFTYCKRHLTVFTAPKQPKKSRITTNDDRQSSQNLHITYFLRLKSPASQTNFAPYTIEVKRMHKLIRLNILAALALLAAGWLPAQSQKPGQKKRRGGAHRFHRHGCRTTRSGGYCQGVARCCHGLAHRPLGNGISAAHQPQRPYATAARRTAERPRPVDSQHNRAARNRHNGRARQLFGQQQLCNLLTGNTVCG